MILVHLLNPVLKKYRLLLPRNCMLWSRSVPSLSPYNCEKNPSLSRPCKLPSLCHNTVLSCYRLCATNPLNTPWCLVIIIIVIVTISCESRGPGKFFGRSKIESICKKNTKIKTILGTGRNLATEICTIHTISNTAV